MKFHFTFLVAANCIFSCWAAMIACRRTLCHDAAKKRLNALYTRFLQNLSRLKVNGGTPSMQLCTVPFEGALHLEVFD